MRTQGGDSGLQRMRNVGLEGKIREAGGKQDVSSAANGKGKWSQRVWSQMLPEGTGDEGGQHQAVIPREKTSHLCLCILKK